MHTERFEMRISPALLSRIDDWRRQEDDIPARAEAVRRLIELGLEAAKQGAQKPTL